MHFSQILVFAIFLVNVCNGFSEYYEKNEDVLNNKVSQLMEWSIRRPVIKLTPDHFKNYVKSQPKNYSIVIMFTALSPSRQCKICREANDEFSIVAHSWRYTQLQNSALFFAMVDFDEGAEIFRMLELNQAPFFIHFPAKGAPKKADSMDIYTLGFSAEAVAKWIQERADITIRIFRPPNYTGTLIIAIFLTFGAAILYLKRNNLEFLRNRTAWAIISLSVVFAMISGQMYNHIRGPPMMHANQQSNQLLFIYPSGEYQFIAETFIVMMLYMTVSVSLVLLNEAGFTPNDSNKRLMFSLGGLGLFAIILSLIISIFRSKYQGYPYSFLIR